MADAVSSAAAAAGASVSDKLNSSRGRLADSEETFLRLLTTQLKNQDPLSPLDSNEFTAQIVQMTGVEQQLMTNDLLAMLVGMNDGGLAGSVNLIGKTVTAETDDAVLTDGAANWTYEIDRSATNVKLEVLNSQGVSIWSRADASVAGGEHTLDWDGVTTTGQQLPDGGTYTLKVTATGSGGETINASTRTTGVATGVQTIDGQTVVSIGKLKIPVSSVIGVASTL
ncbi:MAG: flagellar hook assembly protein FlgD [Caulobacter sp.]|nr:flagellar hook assembly protein FlgD [Caulobacter sp.]